MKEIEKYISPLIKSQFPQFYQEQGPLFILFVEEYYKWLESNNSNYSTYDSTLTPGNPLFHLRRLTDYKDIDKTVEDFLIYFKEKFLPGVTASTSISKRKLVKAAQDIYTSKGTSRSLDLFFRLVYGTKIEIYYPGEDILKPSDGTWVSPIYLELTQSNRTLLYPGKQITGSASKSTAFVEYLLSRNINGKIIDIIFLSNVKGNFITGESILDNNIIDNAPKVSGSLNSIDIITGGELFSVGEIVKIISSRGVEGQARVTEVEAVTGTVKFNIINGGWGYSLDSQSIVSNKVIQLSNVYNTNTSITKFEIYETVSQNLFNFSINNITGNFNVSDVIENGNTSTPSVSVSANVQQGNSILVSNTANVILNQLSGNVFSNSVIYVKEKSYVFTNTNASFVPGDLVTQRTSSSNNNSGVIQEKNNILIVTTNTSSISANGIHVGTFIEQTNTLATGYISAVTRESNFTFTNVSHLAIKNSTGNFNNTDTITAYSNSGKLSQLTTFNPLTVIEGQEYLIFNTNGTGTTRWSTSNSIIKTTNPTVNNIIVFASDIGGTVATSSDITATGNVIGQNTTAIGITTVINQFYGLDKTVLKGLSSNTFANTIEIYTGTGASFSVGTIEETETLRLSNTFFSSYNDGPGSSNIQFKDILLSGANAKFGNVRSVYVFNSGTGYDNSNIVVFSGGNTASGYEVGNASLSTDASGNIISVTLSSNVGANLITTPTTSIVNSTGGSTGVGSGANVVPLSSLGFPRFPSGDSSSLIIDLLSYSNVTVGTITSLSNVSPGENYTAVPFVSVFDPLTTAFNKRDYIIEITGGTGSFIIGERIEQYTNSTGTTLISNTYSGNTQLNYEVFELVYSTDGIVNTASGFVYSHSRELTSNVHTTVLSSSSGTWQNTINVSVLTVVSNTNFNTGDTLTQGAASGTLVSSNSSTLIVKNVTGTFQSNSTNVTSTSSGNQAISGEANTKIYRLFGLTSNGQSDIIDVDTSSSINVTARGKIQPGSNSSSLLVQRLSLVSDFLPSQQILGKTSGATANIISVVENSNSSLAGLNANITANVSFSNGAISKLTIINSGLAYEQDEVVNIKDISEQKIATGKVNLGKQGIGFGYYSSNKGFLNDKKFIQDGEYYQNHSYEIQSNLPLEIYSQMLKNTLHVAGNKLFGKVVITPESNLFISTSSTIVIS